MGFRIHGLLVVCVCLAVGHLGCAKEASSPSDASPGHDVGHEAQDSSPDGGAAPPPTPECLVDEDCPAKRPRCLGLSRRCACSSDPDCSIGARCVLPEGYCEQESVQCRVHSDCLGSMLCSSDGICVVCIEDSDCAPAHFCDAPGRCVERERCVDDGACPEGSFCDRLRGACELEVACVDSSQCGEAQFCDGLEGRCYPARQAAPLCARCGSDQECAGEASRCVTLGRAPTLESGADQRVCARACQTDRECPIGFTCIRGEDGERLCRAGGTEDALSCAEIRSVGRPCVGDAECGVGEGWCLAARCVYGCEELDQGLRFCTEGYRCEAIEEIPGIPWQRACVAP